LRPAHYAHADAISYTNTSANARANTAADWGA
jgi:hypothetical protein